MLQVQHLLLTCCLLASHADSQLTETEIDLLKQSGVSVDIQDNGKILEFEASGLPNYTIQDTTAANQEYEFKVYSFPQDHMLDTPGCLPTEVPIALTVDGVAIYSPYASNGTNAMDDMFSADSCGGYVMDGVYHLYAIPSGSNSIDGCLLQVIFGDAEEGEKFVGVSLDGYAIYRTFDGSAPAAYELDECHGTVVGSTYRYYATTAFPYFLSCYRSMVITPGNPSPSVNPGEDDDDDDDDDNSSSESMDDDIDDVTESTGGSSVTGTDDNEDEENDEDEDEDDDDEDDEGTCFYVNVTMPQGMADLTTGYLNNVEPQSVPGDVSGASDINMYLATTFILALPTTLMLFMTL